jgi:ubiquinone/menaquinone biosynthesis C-methylase UbiE
MRDNLSNEEFTSRWNNDQDARTGSRIDEIDIMLEILKDQYKRETAILDVGIAAGTIEELIFKNIPEVQIVGVETSAEIINIARMKLRQYADWFEIIRHNLLDISSLNLPPNNYSAAISLQTMHNLPHESKRKIIDFVERKLMPGGVFLIIDTLAIESPHMFKDYKSIWKHLEKTYGKPILTGHSYEEYINKLEDKADRPASLEQYLGWLREAGFEPACLCLLGNRALFGARKVGY